MVMNREEFDKKLFTTQKEELLSWLYLESDMPYSLEKNVEAILSRLEQLEKDLEVLKIFENYARVFSNISFDEYLKTYCSEETKFKVKEWLDE